MPGGEKGADVLNAGAGVDVCDGGLNDPAADEAKPTCEFIRNVP